MYNFTRLHWFLEKGEKASEKGQKRVRKGSEKRKKSVRKASEKRKKKRKKSVRKASEKRQKRVRKASEKRQKSVSLSLHPLTVRLINSTDSTSKLGKLSTIPASIFAYSVILW